MSIFRLGCGVIVKEIPADYNESRMIKSTPIAKVAPELKQYAGNIGITKTCAVLGCDDSKNLSSEEFFRFPEDPERRQIWTSLTGRNNWTPTDYSYICVQHFSVDCFYCNAHNQVVLTDKAVPTLKLPRHVLEVEYIDEEEEEYLENDGDVSMESESEYHTEYQLENYEQSNDNTEININQSNISESSVNDSNINELSVRNDSNINEASVRNDLNINEPTVRNGSNISESSVKNNPQTKSKEDNLDLLKLFTEVQTLQRKACSINAKVKLNQKICNRQSRFLNRLKEIIEIKKKLLEQKKKKRARILLSLQDKIREDDSGLVMAMPMRYTDDVKNFALSIYKYSPQAYIYIRNSLRTLLPSTDHLENWIDSGFIPKNVLTSGNMIRFTADHTESELKCKISFN